MAVIVDISSWDRPVHTGLCNIVHAKSESVLTRIVQFVWIEIFLIRRFKPEALHPHARNLCNIVAPKTKKLRILPELFAFRIGAN